ncbi:1-phosphofructokinase family hexose kinase [Lutibaculum baratangense]|uniref:Phosphofructokinase n=1 Tax=Lutibaculum baratangense AMV1 TaxID=631454 RepID=V4R001_9HYPH|nr:1-phosphofructokinase family hexose kinase [Lutibaculum baratangense]ESR25337.1 Tagatose-6-phosphate kinase [Lutibaculum baratangense AMV1]
MSDILTLTMNPAVDLSVTADAVTPTHKIRCREERREAGGGGINVARVVRRLGGDCRALFPAGGSMGDLLVRAVEKEGIATVPVRIAGETRENFTATAAATGEQYRFVLPGPLLSEAEWRGCLDALECCETPRFVVSSGSLPLGCPASVNGEVARISRALGARLVVDSSGDSLKAALDEGVYLCKPSLRELEGVTRTKLPDRASQLAAAKDIVSAGRAAAVALTLGDEGALLVTAERAWFAPPIEVEVRSAVGAGDSFLAGFMWSLAGDLPWEECFAWAVAAGTAAVLTPGSELAERGDIEHLRRDRVLVEPLW